jgi:hypothetical protein
MLAAGLLRLEAEHGLALPVYRLPDLGAIDEPFAPGFGPSLWDAAKEGLGP